MFSIFVVSAVTLTIRAYERHKMALQRAVTEQKKWTRIRLQAQHRVMEHRRLPDKSFFDNYRYYDSD